MNMCRFDNACAAIERAAQVDLQSAEVIGLLKNMRLVGRARSLGNELFKSGRYIEACSAYGEGLSRDSLNLILYCNRATCWYKLEQWEKSLDDCSHALLIQPHYTKALFQKAASNVKVTCQTLNLTIRLIFTARIINLIVCNGLYIAGKMG